MIPLQVDPDPDCIAWAQCTTSDRGCYGDFPDILLGHNSNCGISNYINSSIIEMFVICMDRRTPYGSYHDRHAGYTTRVRCDYQDHFYVTEEGRLDAR